MGEVSKPTRAIERAQGHIKAGFDRASRNIANVPLGKEQVDPRTHKKRLKQGVDSGMDTTLARLLIDIRNDSGEDK